MRFLKVTDRGWLLNNRLRVGAGVGGGIGRVVIARTARKPFALDGFAADAGGIESDEHAVEVTLADAVGSELVHALTHHIAGRATATGESREETTTRAPARAVLGVVARGHRVAEGGLGAEAHTDRG